MAKNKTVLKDYFKGGKIPTESNFADLIDKIPVGGESGKDNTLTTYDTENPYVTGYRFITVDNALTYLIFGLYDASEGVILPYIVIQCHTGRPLEHSEYIPADYAVLTGNQMMDWYIGMGAQLHDADDATVVNTMPTDLTWIPIGGNPGPRTVTDKPDSDTDDTYTVFPAKYRNKWYVSYVIKHSHNHNSDTYKKGIIASGIGYTDLEFNNSDEQLLIALKSSKIKYSNL